MSKRKIKAFKDAFILVISIEINFKTALLSIFFRVRPEIPSSTQNL